MQGFSMPVEGMSTETMAGRLGVDMQKLQQFIADSPWVDQDVWQVIRKEVIPGMEPLPHESWTKRVG